MMGSRSQTKTPFLCFQCFLQSSVDGLGIAWALLLLLEKTTGSWPCSPQHL